MAGHDDKTEQPTPRRLEQARKEGQFPASREFVSGLVFLLFLWILEQNAATALQSYSALVRHLIAQAFVTEFTMREATRRLLWLGTNGGVTLAGVGLTVAVAALGTHLAVTRLGFAWGKLRPDFSRLSPAQRLSQLPSQNLASLAQSLLAIPAFAWVLYSVGRDHAGLLPVLARMSPATAMLESGRVLADLLWKSAFLFFLYGSIDLFRQRSRWSSQLRMSKQEIRDEQKMTDGNPLIKTRIRRIQRDVLRRRMMQQVPKATAVIVNPTHFAVAIRYLPGQMQAPKVVAKGKNWLALRIRETAVRNQVPVVENPPLAQALYAAVNVGQEIPAHLYQAVAEVLAYIYRLLKGRLPGA